ncbi:MAG: hypothetical protein KAF91_19445 [Nostoc sp. TH1S01]|nr:hypothetical protein [Nostoc sp. TH1S01]
MRERAADLIAKIRTKPLQWQSSKNWRSLEIDNFRLNPHKILKLSSYK